MTESAPARENGKGLQAEPNYRLDITAYVCPMTFVKTKLQLEEMEEGETLGLTIRRGESYKNVTRSVHDEGHRILGEESIDKEVVRLIIEKGKE